ncbi:diguanylate phosphodiesterase [Pseudoalteromonas porphyrae]|uniref:Diguanylate phosphodiesterase n=1 Tax=Pseudoalteromonas porphyrae TaxID=187330 RepID=A0A0N1EXJ4_9GAMM|nr:MULTISPECIES: EAL domain-containing protein [Pseudoalteromonas]KPH65376.1 diguanylate phosphodiesterase [Pseudoalteromonas porphyrae]KPH93750.1 diguanylate phosphodiesterase [Pseudoalteromonas porphyrae]
MGDFFLNLIDDDELETVADQNQRHWLIAIIDDEPSVHDVTKLALSKTKIQGRDLKFISAFSGKEGYQLLNDNPECAVVLLDVVMETADAGLVLAKSIRDEMHRANLQIILRTGQPGYAPEEKIISEYEINDYKTKSELTRDKLFTSLATAIRSFSHLQALEESRTGLKNVIHASASLMKERSIHEFACGVLQQMNALFNLSSQGIFCVSQRPLNGPFSIEKSKNDSFLVVATTTQYNDFYGKDIYDDLSGVAPDIAQRALAAKEHILETNISALYLATPSQWQGVVVIEGKLNLSDIDQELLKAFCLNIAIGLENAKFFSHLNRSAYYDSLTEMYNREGLIHFAREIRSQAKRSLSLYIIDIDYFHDIVDSLGFEFGNEVLISMASVLKRIFLKNASIARLHSDVFAVLIADSQWRLKNLILECSRPITLSGSSMRLGVTLGESNCSVDEEFDVELLVRHAKMALKVAKENKRGMAQAFEPKFEEETINRLGILAEFRNALANNELFLMLQPKTSMKTAEVVGYEALIRWQHPQKGLVPPNAFIPVVEQAGLYFELDMYVFRTALNIIKEYPQINKPISVNISANSLHHHDFIDELKKIIKQEKADLGNIELEITENSLVRSDMAILHLNALKDLGFTLCLDDFGAGYSSLAYLLKLPLDVIKIDRAFINYITEDKSARVLLKGMLQICKDLDKRIVVEGVETQEQVDMLTTYDVDVAQGFFYYRPMPITQILEKAL